MTKKIENRIKREKKLILKMLEKFPIVQLACEKVGISRATYYRWKSDNIEFDKDSENAIFNGKMTVNDVTKSNLISLVKDKHPGSIYFWLKNNHKNYSNKNLTQNIVLQTTTKENKEITKILEKVKDFNYEEINNKRNKSDS